MKKAIVVLVFVALASGCQFKAEKKKADPYGEFGVEVQRAEARTAAQTIETEGLIENHRKILAYLKEQKITEYNLSFNADTNRFQLQYKTPKTED